MQTPDSRPCSTCNSFPEPQCPTSAGVSRCLHALRKAGGIWVLWLRDLLISAAHFGADYYVSLSAGARGRHQHVAAAGGPRPAVHQQICLPHRVDRTRRCGGLPLPARPGEELHQARDCAAGRPAADRSRRRSGSTASLCDESYVRRSTATTAPMAEMIVPDDSYFMMGDHRSISSDSREFGPVERRSDLRQSGLRLLAGEGCGRGAIVGRDFHANPTG